MSDRHPLRTQVLAALIAAAILGAIGWLSGTLRPIWDWIVLGDFTVPGYVAAATGVLFLAIVFVLARLERRMRAQRSSEQAASSSVEAGLELRPLGFTVDLAQSVPRVTIQLLAINYLPATLSLHQVTVSRLSFGAQLPHLDNITSTAEPDLAGLSSFMVFCERALADTEARGLIQAVGRLDASISLSARGVSVGKDVKSLKSSLAITGWVTAPITRAV